MATREASKAHRGATKRFGCAAGMVLAAALVVPPCTASAADPPPPAASSEAAPMRAEVVKPGLWRIAGVGDGTLVRAGPKGAIVVDAHRAGPYRRLVAEIQRIAKTTGPPVRALVLTSAGPRQSGGVEPFLDAQVDVVVQRQALAAVEAAAGGKGAGTSRPFITYDADYVVQSGDVQAGVEHVGRGRSGADSIVFFADLRVIAVGDLFTHATPQPDCASGGSFAGWAAALTHVLFFDFDVAVPSRGAPVGRQELVDFRARLQALAERDRCLFQYGSTE